MKRMGAAVGLLFCMTGIGASPLAAAALGDRFLDGVYAITSVDAVEEGAVGVVEFDKGVVVKGSATLAVVLQTGFTSLICSIDGRSEVILLPDATGTATVVFGCPAGDLPRTYALVVTDVKGQRATEIRFQQTEASLTGGVTAFDLHALPKGVVPRL